jgi:FkbM family methyltransferase
MLASRLKRHFKHSRDQIIGSIKIGSRNYRVRGYLPSRLATPTEYEPHVAIAISNILQKRKGVFIDVGANVGQTLFTLLSADPNCSYLGFEPQIACCHYLQQFIDDNRLMPRVQIFPVALSSKNGFLPFFSNYAHDDCGTLVSDLHQRKNMQIVCARKGDDILTELGVSTISAVKIDVEGAELSVLAGLQKTLEKMRPPVIFEVLPNFWGPDRIMREELICTRKRPEADNIYQMLSSIGYALYQIDEISRTLIPIKQFNLDDKEAFRGRDYIALDRCAASAARS